MRIKARDSGSDDGNYGANSTTFFVPDTAPFLQYGDGIKSSWTPGYALQGDGYDQTLHMTTVQDTVAFNLSGGLVRVYSVAGSSGVRWTDVVQSPALVVSFNLNVVGE